MRIERLTALLAELRRRHVIRVVAVYLVMAWVLAQVAATFFPSLGLPEWSVPLVHALLLLGFPVAAVLAWAYDITPAGVERTPPGPIRSVVAVPFATVGSGDVAYLSDGITEEIVGALARVPGLRVAGRSSTYALKSRSLDSREIGARLGVDAAVEGSVREVGGVLRVSVQLTDVRTGWQVWSRSFERPQGEVLALEEDIVRELVAELRGAPPAANVLRRSSTNAEAHELYLRGRHHWNRRTPAALREALARFRAAIALDEDFALAHAGVADCHSVLLDYGVVAPATAWPAAIEAARRAVALDDTIAQTHTALALALQVGLDFDGAERAFRRAIELDPDAVTARYRYALMLSWLRRGDDAREQVLRAQQMEPLSLVVGAAVGWTAYYARRFEDAVAAHARVLDLEPRFMSARLGRGAALLALGRPADAVRDLELAAELSGRSTGVLPVLALALRACDRREAALSIRDEVHAAARTDYASPYHIALTALAADDAGGAIAALEHARAESSPQVARLDVDPLLDELRGPSANRAIAADAATFFPAPAGVGDPN